MFDFLHTRKESIENQLGESLDWNRQDDMAASTIDIVLEEANVANEETWERMASFHSEWLEKFARVFCPLLREFRETW